MLCSRVAILARGRLAAEGQLSDLLEFRVRGWEIVMDGLSDAALAGVRASGHVEKVTALGPTRYALHVGPSLAPDQLVTDLVRQGARLESLNPIRDTLEDVFVRQVASAPASRELEPVKP
jgi:ABC-2 type transport system ATP-binding protein